LAATADSVAKAINSLPVSDAFENLAARSALPALPTTSGAACHAVLTTINPFAFLIAGFAALSRAFSQVSGPLVLSQLAFLPAHPGLFERLRENTRGIRVPCHYHTKRQHALARYYHKALLACSRGQQMHKAFGKMLEIQHEVAMLDEEEADSLHEDNDIE
ncbi:MAG: hypothetical protein M1829_001470, partial [Trizodia sp. TS-e1964]